MSQSPMEPMKTNHLEIKWWHNDFFTEIHLLAGKLVLVVVIHPLGGLRANRPYTPNPQPSVTQPTQDGDP
jgi:hypothetical protein